MNQRAAFDETVALAAASGMQSRTVLDPSLSFDHLLDMQERIARGEFSESKLGRWLGWAQAALVAANVGVGLEDVKQINLRHADDALSQDVGGS